MDMPPMMLIIPFSFRSFNKFRTIYFHVKNYGL
jgi:hypothetical protein